MTLIKEIIESKKRSFLSIKNPNEINKYQGLPPVPQKRDSGISLDKRTLERLNIFSVRNNYLDLSNGLEGALIIVRELTKLVLVIKQIFDTATREKDHLFLNYGRREIMTDTQQLLFLNGVQKIEIDNREDRRRFINKKVSTRSIFFATGVYRGVKGYKTRYDTKSLGHAIDSILDSIYDLRELILTLKDVFKAARDRKDYRELLYSFNQLMTPKLLQFFYQTIDESNGKSR